MCFNEKCFLHINSNDLHVDPTGVMPCTEFCESRTKGETWNNCKYGKVFLDSMKQNPLLYSFICRLYTSNLILSKSLEEVYKEVRTIKEMVRNLHVNLG